MEPVVDELIESLASFRKKLEETPVGEATDSNVNMFDTSERDKMRENNQDFVDRFKKTFDKTPLSVESKKSEDKPQPEKKITLTTTKSGEVDQRTKEYKQLFEQIKTKIDNNNVKIDLLEPVNYSKFGGYFNIQNLLDLEYQPISDIKIGYKTYLVKYYLQKLIIDSINNLKGIENINKIDILAYPISIKLAESLKTRSNNLHI